MQKFIIIGIVLSISMTACMNEPLSNKEAIDAYLITHKGVGIIQIGVPINQIKNKLNNQLTVEEHGNKTMGFDILKNGELQLSISEVNKKVGILEIYSGDYSTKKGVKVGLSIAAIENIYADFTPQMDPHNGRVYFEPEDLQSNNARCNIYFVSHDDSPVWKYTKTPKGNHFHFEPSGEIDKTSVIESIIIEEVR